jgi:hypothetical protein
MPSSNPLSHELSDLGDALRAAVAADLQGAAVSPRRQARTRSRRRIAIAVAAIAVAVPGAAIAADALLSPGQVATGLSSGTLALLGTHPTCTTVRSGVEYQCVLQSPPTDQGGPPAGQWLHTVEPTNGADHRVNGGCRAQNGAGTVWECYVGETAVRRQIIGHGFLGQRTDGPGVG